MSWLDSAIQIVDNRHEIWGYPKDASIEQSREHLAD
jgi:hypothetical protein